MLAAAGLAGHPPAVAASVGTGMSRDTLAAAPLPEIVLPDGSRYLAQQARGKILVINFWASWCGPCRKELPSLDRLATRRRDVTVVAVSVDAAPADAITAFAGRYPHLRLGFASMGALTRYGALGLPYSIVFDRKGHEAARLPRALDWDRVQPELLRRPR